MRRRPVLALLGATAGVVAPAALRAQARAAKLGVLTNNSRTPIYEAAFKRLAERGWVEGRNLVIDFHSLGTEMDPKRWEASARALASQKCDVILAHSTPAALAAHAGAPLVPMVFVLGGDPVALGLVKSLQRPGGHATGYVQQSHEVAAKQLGLLRELAPKAKRIAVMFEAGNPSMLQGVRTVESAAQPLGLNVHAFPLHDWRDVDAAALAWTRDPVDGLLVLNDRITVVYGNNIASLARRFRLPAVYGSRDHIDFGGMVSYGADYSALLVDSADYVARILAGAKPAELPVQQPTRFELVVNLGLARYLGIAIPQSVLLQATEVIR